MECLRYTVTGECEDMEMPAEELFVLYLGEGLLQGYLLLFLEFQSIGI